MGTIQLDASLFNQRIADVDPRGFVERPIGRGQVVTRDRLTHRRDAVFVVRFLLLRGLLGLAQPGDLGRLRVEAFGLGEGFLSGGAVTLIDRRACLRELGRELPLRRG
jgi:hypothetical protein